MKVTFRNSFNKDLKKIEGDNVLNDVFEAINDVKSAISVVKIKNFKKLQGFKTNYYARIKIKNYRIGLNISENNVDFVRCLQRKDFYKYFPQK